MSFHNLAIVLLGARVTDTRPLHAPLLAPLQFTLHIRVTLFLFGKAVQDLSLALKEVGELFVDLLSLFEDILNQLSVGSLA